MREKAFENIVRKEENAKNKVTFILSSSKSFKLDWSKILLHDKELKRGLAGKGLDAR